MKKYILLFFFLLPFLKVSGQTCTGPVVWNADQVFGMNVSFNTLQPGESGSFSAKAGDIKTGMTVGFTYNWRNYQRLGFQRNSDGLIHFSPRDIILSATSDSDILSVERSINAPGESVITYKINGAAVTSPACPSNDCSQNLGVYTDPINVMMIGSVPATVSFCGPMSLTAEYPRLDCGQGGANLTTGKDLRISVLGGLELAGGGYKWERFVNNAWTTLPSPAVSNTLVFTSPVPGTRYQIRVTDAQGKSMTNTCLSGNQAIWEPVKNIVSGGGATFSHAYSNSFIPPYTEGWIEYVYDGSQGFGVSLLDKNTSSPVLGAFIAGGVFYLYYNKSIQSSIAIPANLGDVLRVQRKKYNTNGTDRYMIEVTVNDVVCSVNGSPWSVELPGSSSIYALGSERDAWVISPMFTSFTACTPLSAYVSEQINNEGLVGSQMNVHARGGVGPYDYKWSDGFVGDTRNGLHAGDYTVTVSDKAGNTKNYTYGVGNKAAWNGSGNTTLPLATNNANLLSDGSLAQTVTSAQATAGALNQILANKDGWVEYVNRDNTGMHFRFGWMNAGQAVAYTVKDPALSTTLTETFAVSEAALPPLITGDVVRIARTGSIITVSLNGAVQQSFPTDKTQILTLFASVAAGTMPYMVTSQTLPINANTGLTSLGTIPGGTNAGNDYNYVTENTILVPVTDEARLAGLNIIQQSQKTTYFDGLGRPLQSVITQGSPDKKDIVQPVEYDAFGREPKKYLPYVSGETTGAYKTNALGTGGMQQDFYVNTARTDVVRDNAPFAETIFEASPLNRVLEQGAPGTAWQLIDKTGNYNNTNPSVRKLERTNTAGEVRLWTYNFDTGTAASAADATGFYQGTDATNTEGQLFVSETKDEKGVLTREYKDKEGRVVCKKAQKTPGSEAISDWIETDYIYDDFGNLRFVLPPMANNNPASVLTNNTYIIGYTGDFTTNWLFTYDYDERHRLIEKQVPGGGLTSMVYDLADRLVLSQDAAQKTRQEWSFVKYDAFSRHVMSGLYTDSRTGADIQTALTLSGQTGNLFETRLAGTTHGYTTVVFPSTNLAVQSVSYYDDYDFNNNGNDADDVKFVDINNNIDIIGYPTDKFRAVGKATGSKTLILNPTNEIRAKVPDGFLWNIPFYDKYGRVVQTQSGNIMGGTELNCTLYDFSGKALEHRTFHNRQGGVASKSILNKSTYDHAGRVLKTTMQVDGENEEEVGAYKYNSLGQLLNKNLNNALDQINYNYNIRGWMGSMGGKLFSMSLAYEYNGNISAQYFSSSVSGAGRLFSYNYDGLNRLGEANYQNYNNNTESFYTAARYDDNGQYHLPAQI